MTDSTRAPPRSQPNDPLEERLANAEQAAAIALDTFAYDELILVATEALKHRPQTQSKAVIKSRKNLLWARSHAYHHQNRYELALKDAKAALKVDPDDVAAYIRAAVLLCNTGHNAQAFSCLDTAQSLAIKYESTTRALWLTRIERQRRIVSGSSRHLIDNLPNEIFVEIASHLDVADRTSMSQTCRLWRHMLISAPSLWTSLTLTTKHKRMGVALAQEWIRYILMRSERANHALERVAFLQLFPEKLLEKVCGILRQSAASLKHIEIPTSQESICYERLYRHCPRLTSLVFKPKADVKLPDNAVEACPHIPALKETDKVEPFSLESLHVDPRSRVARFLDKHLHEAHTVIGYNPFLEFEVGSTQETQTDLSLADHLEEWKLEAPIAYERIGAPPLSVTFPRLTKLSRFKPHYRSQLKLTFPNLLDLEYDADCTLLHCPDNLVHVLKTSPMLRSITFTFGVLLARHAQVREALFTLHHLEELNMAAMDTQGHDMVSEHLLPRAVSSESGQIEVSVPWPKLRFLSLDAQSTDLNKLAFSFAVRERLELGDNLAQAKHEAAEWLQPPRSRSTPAVLPFQRGSTSSDRTKVYRSLHGPRLKGDLDSFRLRELWLVNVDEISDNILEVLDCITDFLRVEYRRL
ncbi:uncharacterized protein SRS1_13369 [Sporisorium reilianum f. sp. reilianum]|uniref:F-box domain-containing protein n=1 Tax=Sporisorium reilianum f. sp. reilianum TaxID=72559 RepID=A0A2N8UCS7_9BASI|nr:uncharacterized protein SRS1_13369 [Sporisorium reilianum f. sp. reilianum]